MKDEHFEGLMASVAEARAFARGEQVEGLKVRIGQDELIEPTAEELQLYDQISDLAQSLWRKSSGMKGLSTDPKMFSNSLFRRLWSNHRGYTLLWNESFRLESDIILRSAIETAICISALVVMRDDFIQLMKQDAAHTLLSQIKLHRESDSIAVVRSFEATYRQLMAGLPANIRAAKLDWRELAKIGSVPHLYEWHRSLSGLSSHITGVSILDGFGGDGLDEMHSGLENIQRKMHLMQMAVATLQGSQHHATLIGADDAYKLSCALFSQIDEVSWNWPGVENSGQ